jgi:hypothetical protein
MPVAPGCISVQSACAKTASPGARSNDPTRAPPLTTSSQVSRSASRRQAESAARSSLSNTKCALATSSVRASVGGLARTEGTGIRGRDCLLGVKLTLPAVVEQAECRVAALLDLRDHESGADRVDRPGGHDYDVARRHGPPAHTIGYRAVFDGRPQLLRRETPIEPEGDLGPGGGAEDVPGFGLAARQAHLVCQRIVGMNLDGKWLVGEQQLEQERRFRGGIRSLVVDFTNRAAVMARVAPGTQIENTPRLGQGMRACTFNHHEPLPHLART